MADDRQLAAAVDAAFLEQLSPYARRAVTAGEGSLDDMLADEYARRTRQQAELDQHAPMTPQPGMLVVRWCTQHGWERVGTIDDTGQFVADPTE